MFARSLGWVVACAAVLRGVSFLVVTHHRCHCITVIRADLFYPVVDSFHFRTVWILSTRRIGVVGFGLRWSGCHCFWRFALTVVCAGADTFLCFTCCLALQMWNFRFDVNFPLRALSSHVSQFTRLRPKRLLLSSAPLV